MLFVAGARGGRVAGLVVLASSEGRVLQSKILRSSERISGRRAKASKKYEKRVLHCRIATEVPNPCAVTVA